MAWPTTNDPPEAIPALWYSVVSIWRLQTLMTRLEEDAKMLELWQVHTSAWLVRTIVAKLSDRGTGVARL